MNGLGIAVLCCAVLCAGGDTTHFVDDGVMLVLTVYNKPPPNNDWSFFLALSCTTLTVVKGTSGGANAAQSKDCIADPAGTYLRLSYQQSVPPKQYASIRFPNDGPFPPPNFRFTVRPRGGSVFLPPLVLVAGQVTVSIDMQWTCGQVTTDVLTPANTTFIINGDPYYRSATTIVTKECTQPAFTGYVTVDGPGVPSGGKYQPLSQYFDATINKQVIMSKGG